jgi:integrase
MPPSCGRLLYVSRQLGHANVSITADTYAKWIRPVGLGVVNTLAIPSVV